MSGKINISRLVKSTILLSLFLFALTAQGIHQFNNPAQAPKECDTVDLHFHQDSQAHNCDLCDYKINLKAESIEAQTSNNSTSELILSQGSDVVLDKYLWILRRGPPSLY